MTRPRPLSPGTAWRRVARCVVTAVGMLAQGRVHRPPGHVGRRVRFADGTTGRVYRETVVDRPPPTDPCVLLVAFRLRRVRGAGHALFERESILNTPLFVGFPGFVSKLWLAHDDRGTYRGLYEWDGRDRAEQYARSLWRVLELVSEKGSIDFRVVPGLHRDDVLADPDLLDGHGAQEAEPWWRVVAVA